MSIIRISDKNGKISRKSIDKKSERYYVETARRMEQEIFLEIENNQRLFLKRVVKILGEINLYKFPYMYVCSNSLTDDLHTVTLRKNYLYGEFKEPIEQQFDQERNEMNEKYKPILSILFRPSYFSCVRFYKTKNDTITPNVYDGFVNVDYNEYGKIWYHLDGKPFELKYFIKG